MSSATDSGPPDDPDDAARDPERRRPSCGAPRRSRTTRDDLPGQPRLPRRTREGPTGEIEDPVDPAATGDASVPGLPALEGDVYLLEPGVTGPRRRRRAVRCPLYALALDAALSAGGDVVWIDAGGHATTRALARVAPSERALDRVRVARAFTTHQHHTLVEQVGRWFRGGPEGPFGGPDSDRPAVLVCPALDALYREGELRESDSRSLLVRALAVVGAVARDRDVPVVLTRTREDDYAAPIDRTATTITLERTRFGPRFECADLEFETSVYPVDDGIVQTTFAFWREVLAARHSESGTGRPESPTAATPGGHGRHGGHGR